jgi:hypothetical protein
LFGAAGAEEPVSRSWHLISSARWPQWDRADIPVSSFLQDGENSLGDGNTIAAWEDAAMAVWFGRCVQGADTLQAAEGTATKMGRVFSARLLAGQFIHDSPATGDHRRTRTTAKHLIIDTACCTHENARTR